MELLKTHQLAGLLARLFGWHIELLQIITLVLEERNSFCVVVTARFVA